VPYVVKEFMTHLVNNRYRPLFEGRELSQDYSPMSKDDLCGDSFRRQFDTHAHTAQDLLDGSINEVVGWFNKMELISRYMNLFNYVELVAYWAHDIQHVGPFLVNCLPYVTNADNSM